MLVEKEVVAPGPYWYVDEKTNVPRKLDVTPDLTKYWCEQGNAMLSAGLTVPVPYEHDFNAHPMTPKDKLLNNSGWTKEYRLHDGKGNPGNILHAVLNIEDEEVAKKLPRTIRWTSPWINSFTDGKGKQWNNVISHIALTLRPRISGQAPFPSITAALSMALSSHVDTSPLRINPATEDTGFCLSRAGRLTVREKDKALTPMFPMAFSMFSGATLDMKDMPPAKGKKDKSKAPESQGGKPDSNPTPSENEEVGKPDKEGDDAFPSGEGGSSDNIDLPPLGDVVGDVSMEEVLCDLLRALGVNVEHSGDEGQFKRNLYTATMQKVHELTSKGMNKDEEPKPGAISKDKPPGSPGSPGSQPNPIIQQEQQPMYMSLDEIGKISDPTMKTIALSMHHENEKLRAKVEASEKVTNSLRDAKLKEAQTKRTSRVSFLSRVSPDVKADLESMLALPSMALSMGDGGEVIDPMNGTLALLEKSLSKIPQLLTLESKTLSVVEHPTDESVMSEERSNELADGMARRMGAPVEQKRAS